MNKKRPAAASPVLEVKRCAVYTRKSTTAGLDQEFNSLDAQRETCAQYVRNQACLGWQLSSETYDDGGFTGANLERPAFTHLMQDVEAGKIDVVVVYKVDRLSRPPARLQSGQDHAALRSDTAGPRHSGAAPGVRVGRWSGADDRTGGAEGGAGGWVGGATGSVAVPSGPDHIVCFHRLLHD